MRVDRDGRLDRSHPDFEVLSKIESELVRQAGGFDSFRDHFPLLVRQAIDEVIDTLRTGRISWEELEKTEKTYVGTKVEIIVRDFFKLPRGILDVRIAGHDVDVKYTFLNNWMIPPEVSGRPCILIASDEARRTCYFGLFVARREYLRPSVNRDSKTSISAAGRRHIHWLLDGTKYPEGFWSSIGKATGQKIMEGPSGAERVRRLFRLVQNCPVHRDIIADVGQQKDPMRRIRKNGGARDQLGQEGIAVLTGKYHSHLIAKLGLPFCSPDEAISHQPRSSEHQALLLKEGIIAP